MMDKSKGSLEEAFHSLDFLSIHNRAGSVMLVQYGNPLLGSDDVLFPQQFALSSSEPVEWGGHLACHRIDIGKSQAGSLRHFICPKI